MGYEAVIDVGHGGADPGAVDGTANDAIYTEEEDRNLDIALKTGAALARCGIKPIYTRTSDVGLTLGQRVAIANGSGADIFMSFHCNGGPDGSTARGIEVFRYYNSVSGLALANAVYNRLDNVSPWSDRGVKEAGFYVLKYTKMPAILTEFGFINNTEEEKALAQPAYRLALAEAQARGVCDYLKVPYIAAVPVVTYNEVRIHTSSPEVQSYKDLAKRNNDFIKVTATTKESFKEW